MPYKTMKQERWANSPTGKAKMGTKVVNEFNKASKGLSLPETVKKINKDYKGNK